MKQQIDTIAKALTNAFPDRATTIRLHTLSVKEKLDALIAHVDTLLSGHQGACVVVAHGAYGYLCRDYGLEQLSLEHEGKEPCPATLQELVAKAKTRSIHTVFALVQYPQRSIERIAQLLEAQVVSIDPYATNYFENLLSTAQRFKEALDERR